MTGLNVFNGQSDPIALADDKYPEWLWKIPSTRQTEFTDKEKLSRKFLRFQTRKTIKENSLKKKL